MSDVKKFTRLLCGGVKVTGGQQVRGALNKEPILALLESLE